MSLIIDLQLFPVVEYFKIISKVKDIKFDISENFQKRSFRNRYPIATANRLLQLSVPLKGGREQKCVMSKVQIDYSIKWQEQHWKTLVSAYRKAPFFEHYEGFVKGLIFQEEKLLSTVSLRSIRKISELLKIEIEAGTTLDFRSHYPNDLDLRNLYTPQNFQAPELAGVARYSQVFEDRIGFQPNLSILDLLFCAGPGAVQILTPTSTLKNVTEK